MHREVFVNLAAVTMVVASSVVSAGQGVRRSQPISSVLREPLPPEELMCSKTDDAITIEGPTFSYAVRRASGAIASLRVVRDGEPVIESTGPADVGVNTYRLTSDATAGKTDVEYQGKDKVVLRSEGVLKDGGDSSLSYAMRWTFFNDGVAVCDVRLRPERDLSVRDCAWRVPVRGRFGQYLHKTRDDNGVNAAMAKLPGAGEAARFTTLTSCLQVFSADAALAAFTDRERRGYPDLDSAEIDVYESAPGRASLTLCQYVVHVKPEAEAYVVKGGSEFMFRVGMSVAPNRLPHPSHADLRMFIWIGDASIPTRPTRRSWRWPGWVSRSFSCTGWARRASRARRPTSCGAYCKTVHEAGMLFLWDENADLMYANAPGVVEMKARASGRSGRGSTTAAATRPRWTPTAIWSPLVWRRPTAWPSTGCNISTGCSTSTPSTACTWTTTSPMRIAGSGRSTGIRSAVYDCLIELHDMNWRRRELFRPAMSPRGPGQPLHQGLVSPRDLRFRRAPLRRRLRLWVAGEVLGPLRARRACLPRADLAGDSDRSRCAARWPTTMTC